MANDPVPAGPPPKEPSRLWKWTKRIGCTFVLVVLGIVLTCCGVTCGGLWFVDNSARDMNKAEVDLLFAEALKDGDVKKMHDHADAAFRAKVSREELQAFLDARPGLMDRNNFIGMHFVRRKVGKDEYLKVETGRGWALAGDSMIGGERWEIVCKVVDGVLLLVGISPGLDDLVPQELKYNLRSHGRRGRGWD
jgi:hypothetical protein